MTETWFLIVVFLVWCRHMWLAVASYRIILNRRKEERELAPDVPEIEALNRAFRQDDKQKIVGSLLLDGVATLMYILLALFGLHLLPT